MYRLISKILDKDPKNRLGSKSKDEIKKHSFFREIDWKKMSLKQVKPPINLSDVKKEIDNRRKKVKYLLSLEEKFI